MRVLATGTDKNGILQSVTLETTAEESMELVYYSNYNSLYLGLVDGASYQYTDVKNPYFTPGTGSVTTTNKGDEMLETVTDEETKEDTDKETEKTDTTEDTTEENTEEDKEEE